MSDRQSTGARRAFAGLAIAALAVTALGGAAAAQTKEEAIAGFDAEGVMGGTITVRNASGVSSWDPCVVQAATVPGTMGEMLNAVYGALVYTDVNGVVQPAMVESLTTEDAVHWVFKLRPDVTFTDGTSFDAEAVKYNFDRAADPDTACTSGSWIGTWESVDVIDPLTVQVTLPAPDGNFDLKIAELAAFIGSPAALEAAGDDKTLIQPVGAGPFMLESWDQGVRTVLVRNPGYWDAPRPYIDTFDIPIVPESNTGQNMIVQGQMDFMMGYPYQYGANATMPGVTTQEVPINGYNIAYFVTDGGPTGLFNDVRARQAVAYGVDRSKWVQALTQDPASTFPVSLYPEDSPYFDASLVYPEFDPEMAQQLIDEVIADGTPFEFVILVPNSSDTLRSAQYLQQAINAYEGASAEILTVEGQVYNQECYAKNGDVCLQPGASMWNSPEPNTFNLLSCVGSQPFAAYCSEEMEAALGLTLTAVTPEEKVAAYGEVQRVFMQDLPILQYGTQRRSMLKRDDTDGYVHAGQGQVQAQYLYRCDGPCSE